MAIPTKTNADYSASAINLNNNAAVKELLDSLHTYQKVECNLQEQIEKLTPGLHEELKGTQDRINSLRSDIEKAIDDSGSYQDIAAGIYAVKQKRVSKQYNGVEPFKIHFGEFTPEVLVEALDVKAIERLVKAGRIREADLKERGVITEKETFVYVIR